MERGKILQRRLDAWVGIPLTILAGCASRMRRMTAPKPSAAADAKRVGVLCLGAIGDLLLVTGLLSGLRHELPDARIEIITSKANAACAALLPAGFESTAFAVTDIRGMLSHIRAAQYDIFIDTGQWARISALMSTFSGAGLTVGFATSGQYRHYVYDNAVPHRSDRHEADNFIALGKVLFPNISGAPNIAMPCALSSSCPPLPEGKWVFCHMWPSGIRSHLKEWPAEYWGELAALLTSAGYVALFTGGPQDARATGDFLKKHVPVNDVVSGRVVSVAGQMSLPDLAWCLRRAEAVISVNTGIMHLAAIAGAPTVALNGPTNPLRWGPVGAKARSLLPEKGRSAYLNLGFEYGAEKESVLRHLPVVAVRSALADLGVRV